MMKPQNFKKGEVFLSEVVDHIHQHTLIISIHGHLLRVENQSLKQIQRGDLVKLIVSSTQPLRFKIHKQKERQSYTRSD